MHPSSIATQQPILWLQWRGQAAPGKLAMPPELGVVTAHAMCYAAGGLGLCVLFEFPLLERCFRQTAVEVLGIPKQIEQNASCLNRYILHNRLCVQMDAAED